MEYNTIASSFCGLADKVSKMHSYVLGKYGEALALNYGASSDSASRKQLLNQDSDMAALQMH